MHFAFPVLTFFAIIVLSCQAFLRSDGMPYPLQPEGWSCRGGDPISVEIKNGCIEKGGLFSFM